MSAETQQKNWPNNLAIKPNTKSLEVVFVRSLVFQELDMSDRILMRLDSFTRVVLNNKTVLLGVDRLGVSLKRLVHA
jgi:DNA-binding transcriptional regulator/RsmH inhibitor MraZ